ncbi:MAG: hypothetical protein AAF558_14945 [Verrucomicrobiota bacterium]
MKSLPIFILGFFALATQIGIYFAELTVPVGSLQDPDCYMRLVRIQTFLADGDWFNQIIAQGNAPYGEELHWSRSLDLLILSLYLPLTVVLDQSQALLWAGILISPLLLLPCLYAIDTVARHYVPFEGRLVLALFFLSQPGIINYFVAGRPDHHCLILTLLIASLATTAHCLRDPSKRTYFITCGLWVALALWTSVESLVIWASVLGCFTILWLANARTSYNIAIFQTVVCGLSLVFVASETPKLLFKELWLDRLSGYHVLLFALISIAWWVLVLFTKKAILPRTVAGVCSAGTALLITVIIFPELLNGPFGQVDLELKKVWLQQVQELHPLGKDLSSWAIGILAWLPAMIPGIAYLIYMLTSSSRRSSLKNTLFACWLFIAGMTTALAFWQKRWVSYADILWIIPAALGIFAFLQSFAKTPFFRPLRAVVLVGVCAGPVFLSSLLDPKDLAKPMSAQATPSKLSNERQVEVKPTNIYTFLSQLRESRPLTLLAFIDHGPELIYRTGNHVLTSPYHRNHQGILDAHTVLSTEEPLSIIAILEQRRVDYIIIQNNETEPSYYDYDEDGKSLYHSLAGRTPPAWLTLIKEIPAKDGLYLIYKVNLSENTLARLHFSRLGWGCRIHLNGKEVAL